MNFKPILDNLDSIYNGIIGTLVIGFGALIISLFLGILFALMKTSKNKLAIYSSLSFIEFFRNTPFLAQLFFWYFGLPALGINFSPLVTSLLALGICSAATTAEIVRSGLLAVDYGTKEAASALGLNKLQLVIYVILPIALQVCYKPLTSNFINLFLTTSVALSITANELMGNIAMLQANYESNTFEIYLAALILYGLLTTTLSVLAKLIDYIWISKTYKKRLLSN